MALGGRQLYFIRHARAEERGPSWPDDALRPLTAAGAERFSVAVRGLARFDALPQVVLTSPFVRARQTADLLAAAGRPRLRVIEEPSLAPGAAAATVVQALATVRRATRIAVVGHEPDLGAVVGHLLGSKALVPFKKGAICRIDLAGNIATLMWFLPPAALRALARP